MKSGLGRIVSFCLCGVAVVGLVSCDLLSGGATVEAPPDVSAVQTIIGRGYDVFDDYANPEFIKASVFDFEALETAGIIERTSIDQTTAATVAGSSMSEYQTNMGSQVDIEGDYQFFSGAVGASFTNTSFSSTSTEYATVQIRVRKAMYAMKNRSNPAALSAYLDQDFLDALNDDEVDPLWLFKTYGTHAMTAVILGARYDYSVSARANSSTSASSMTSYAQASYASVFAGGSVATGYSSNETVMNEFTKTESNVRAIGGNSNLAALSGDGLNAWLGSIGEDSVVFSDWASSDSLIPLWEFCTDAERAADIEEKYAAHQESKRVQVNAQANSGRLRFYLTRFDNKDVMDGAVGGDAEWLWQVRLYSALDGTTRKLVSRTDKDNAATVGQGEEHDFNYNVTWDNVPLDQVYNFRLRPYLEECDGKDLGDEGNNIFCNYANGPYFDFESTTDGRIRFAGHGPDGYSRAWLSTTSFQTGSNDSFTLDDGDEQVFYLVMREQGNTNDDTCQFRLRVEWDWND